MSKEGINIIYHLTDTFEELGIIDVNLEFDIHFDLISYWNINE